MVPALVQPIEALFPSPLHADQILAMQLWRQFECSETCSLVPFRYREVALSERSVQQTEVEYHSDPALSRSETRRVILGVGVGNLLEWYDWTIYAVFVPFFAAQFFPSGDPTAQILSGLAVFAVGFFMRPVGAVLFGRLADARGRKLALTLSMIVMAVASMAIGLTPSFQTIGIAAPILLVAARLAQGFAHGAEPISAYTYLAEKAPAAKRGLWASSVYLLITLGVMLGTIVGAILSSSLTATQMASWGWRAPFLFGGVLGIYALYLRRNLQETEAFTESKKAGTISKPMPLMTLIARHKADVARVFGLMLCLTVVYWTWGIAAPAYAISMSSMDASQALWAGVGALGVFAIALPIWGALSDRWGRRPIGVIFAVLIGAFSHPLAALSTRGPWSLFLAMSLALVIVASLTSIIPVYMAEMFPTSVRATAMAIPYGLATAIFGGTAPYIRTWLTDQNLDWAFSIYIGILAIVALATVLSSRETKGLPLQA